MLVNITSWNTRGNSIARTSEACGSILREDMPNIVLIQEGGNVERFHESFPVSLGRHNFNAYYFEQPDAEIYKCTTGILTETPFSVNFMAYEGMGKRPIVCACTVVSDQKGSREYIIATVHLTAAEGIAGEELIDMNLAFNHQFPGKNWLIMGDFNCPPDKLDLSDSPIPVHIAVSNSPTHESGKTFDYAIFSDSLKGRVSLQMGGANDKGFVPASSDHFPVYCMLDL